MAARGQYAKGIAKREEILTVALEIIARDGYSRATVKELADAAGLSQNGLLHYFGSKDALFTEILRRRDEADEKTYDDAAGDGDLYLGVSDLLARNANLPGFVQMHARLSNEASEPHHPAHDYFRSRYERIREKGTEAFARLQEQGRVPADADPAQLAVIMFALIDGLQTQWMYDADVDMTEHVQVFLRLAGVPASPS